MADTSSSCGNLPLDRALLENLLHSLRDDSCSSLSSSEEREEEQRKASKELRNLTKQSSINRVCIAEAGAIPILIKKLRSNDFHTQANAIAALLNLTLKNEENKKAIIYALGVDPIVEALQKGLLLETRENAAALLFNLSYCNSVRVMVSSSKGVFTGLVCLLDRGSSRGKKDAAAALYNLLQIRGNRALAVRAGAVPPLVGLAQDPSSCLVDESLTVLLSLASHQEGRFAIRKARGSQALLGLLERGSDSNKEYACAVLLVLCHEDYGCVEEVCNLNGLELLAELCASGTERAQRKAAKLIKLLK